MSEDSIVLLDAVGREIHENTSYPFLAFDVDDGRLTIADDYETSNDPTARDFILTKEDAIQLAARLLDYATQGTTSSVKCVSRYDVEAALAAGRIEPS